MREMGVLSGVEETGRGGFHWVYSPKLDEARFKRFIIENMLDRLIDSLRNAGSKKEDTLSRRCGD